MQITDVRIRKIEKEGKMKAVVSITIDEEFHDIKIIEGEKGMFIAMPSHWERLRASTKTLPIRSSPLREN